MSGSAIVPGALTPRELIRIAYAEMLEQSMKGEKWSPIQLALLEYAEHTLERDPDSR